MVMVLGRRWGSSRVMVMVLGMNEMTRVGNGPRDDGDSLATWYESGRYNNAPSMVTRSLVTTRFMAGRERIIQDAGRDTTSMTIYNKPSKHGETPPPSYRSVFGGRDGGWRVN